MKEEGKEVKSSALRKTGLLPSPQNCGKERTATLGSDKAINSPRAPLPALSGKAPSLLLFVPES